MVSSAQNRQAEAPLTELFARWDQHASQYGDVLYGCALLKNGDIWGCATMFVVPLKHGSVKNDLHLDYGELLILRGMVTVASAKALLSDLVRHGQISLPDAPKAEVGPLQAGMVRRHGSHSRQGLRYQVGYATFEYLLHARSPQNSRPASGLYVSPSLPLFPHPYAAVEHLLDVRVINQGTPELFALAPDYRARVRTVVVSAGAVNVYVESSEEEGTIIGKVYFDEVQGRKAHFDLAFAQGVATFETSGYPRYLIIALLCRNSGDVIDEWVYDPNAGLDSGATIETDADDLETLILGGESETLEFKRQIPDREGLAKSISAFANCRGGRILIGVEDDAEIVGCDGVKSQDRITQITDHHCDPIPAFKMESITLREKTIIVITVPEGTNKPYFVDSRIHIRVGATKRPAKRHEVDQMYPARPPIVLP